MNYLEGDHLDELPALLALSEQGSYVAAVRALERHPSAVSKRIAAIEELMGRGLCRSYDAPSADHRESDRSSLGW
jgi:hypothetical protein